jgi:hypothetical protein
MKSQYSYVFPHCTLISPTVSDKCRICEQIKVKFTPEQAMKAQSISRHIDLLFNLGDGWRWAVNATSQLLYPQERDLVHILQEAG